MQSLQLCLSISPGLVLMAPNLLSSLSQQTATTSHKHAPLKSLNQGESQQLALSSPTWTEPGSSERSTATAWQQRAWLPHNPCDPEGLTR